MCRQSYTSDELQGADLTISEGNEDGSDCGEDGVLGQCGRGLMTMGFQVPLGGDGDEGDSCLEVFFGYVRRGIANEILRAVRRWALDGSERDGDGNTAVHIAAIHGNTSIVEVRKTSDTCTLGHPRPSLPPQPHASCRPSRSCFRARNQRASGNSMDAADGSFVAAPGQGGLRLLEVIEVWSYVTTVGGLGVGFRLGIIFSMSGTDGVGVGFECLGVGFGSSP